MRLWHYKLIPVLPSAQLKAQRYEIGDIVVQWNRDKKVKNRLVNYCLNYHHDYLGWLFKITIDEMDKRGIGHNAAYDKNIYDFCNTYKELYYKEHNEEYLKICYYNLKEKYLRGIITEEEWQKIESLN